MNTEEYIKKMFICQLNNNTIPIEFQPFTSKNRDRYIENISKIYDLTIDDVEYLWYAAFDVYMEALWTV